MIALLRAGWSRLASWAVYLAVLTAALLYAKSMKQAATIARHELQQSQGRVDAHERVDQEAATRDRSDAARNERLHKSGLL